MRPGRPPSTRRSTLTASVIVLATIVLGACGGSGSETSTARPPSTTVADVDWRAEVDRRCAALSEQFGDLADAEPSDRASALAHIERMTQFAEAAVAAATPLSSPDAGPDAAALAADLGELRAVTDAMAAAAEAGDTAAVDRSVDELDAVSDRINAGAAALGLDSCGGF